MQIEAVLPRRAGAMRPAALRRLQRRNRHVALRRDVRGRILLQLRVEVQPRARVVHRPGERVVFELPEAALPDLELRADVRLLSRARDRARRAEPAGELRRAPPDPPRPPPAPP